jgi:phage terminase large subunit-like protein
VLNARLRTAGNPLLRWSVANASVISDPAGGRKLDKRTSHGRIDPLVATVIAIGQAAPQTGPSA